MFWIEGSWRQLLKPIKEESDYTLFKGYLYGFSSILFCAIIIKFSEKRFFRKSNVNPVFMLKGLNKYPLRSTTS